MTALMGANRWGGRKRRKVGNRQNAGSPAVEGTAMGAATEVEEEDTAAGPAVGAVMATAVDATAGQSWRRRRRTQQRGHGQVPSLETPVAAWVPRLT